MTCADPYIPDRGLAAKLSRRLVQWRSAAPMTLRPDRPLLSVTFDDCPKSAATLGAAILDEAGVRGCYYVASGLLDTDTVMGRIAARDDLKALHKSGHEIGAHTHSHTDCAKTGTTAIFHDIDRNLDVLADLTAGTPVESFAFPFGETTFGLKKQLAARFSSLRGILAGPNRGQVDRSQLRAFEMDGSESSMTRILTALTQSARTPGWTILFTHDVSETPSPFGMTPDQLRTVIRHARERGTAFRTPAEVMAEFGRPGQ